MSVSQTTANLQDQVLDALRRGQDAVIVAIKSLAESAAPITRRLPASSYTDRLPKAADIVDSTFGFAQKLLANQKDFTAKLIEASSPASTAAKPASKTTSKTTTKAA